MAFNLNNVSVCPFEPLFDMIEDEDMIKSIEYLRDCWREEHGIDSEEEIAYKKRVGEL